VTVFLWLLYVPVAVLVVALAVDAVQRERAWRSAPKGRDLT
jgi:hypothetical protein